MRMRSRRGSAVRQCEGSVAALTKQNVIVVTLGYFSAKNTGIEQDR